MGRRCNMGKVLFIISLKYPIINAINLCLKYEMKADIILIDHGNDLRYLAPKLQKTNLFEKVFLVNGEKQNKLKSFLKGETCIEDVFEWGINSFQKLFVKK